MTLSRLMVGSFLVASLLAFSGCRTVDQPASAEVRVIVTVRFQSRFDADEIRRRYPKRMPQFRALPGLVQKYYLHDPKTRSWAGIYLWESEGAVAAYLKSDLRKTIPEAYGVIGQPRVESYQLVDTLR